MESSSKRRKLDHSGSGLRHDGLIDFEARSSARVSTASTFVLQTDELLKEAKLDYAKALKGVDAHLHRLKEAIDSAPPHDAVPVCLLEPINEFRTNTFSRLLKLQPASRRNTASLFPIPSRDPPRMRLTSYHLPNRLSTMSSAATSQRP